MTIVHDFPIQASIDRVFDAVSSPAGLDTWWTDRSTGQPQLGHEYELSFGPDFLWRATVTSVVSPTEFALQLTQADADWTGSEVRFRLAARGSGTWVQFEHRGWPAVNEHFRTSNMCWAMYLRILRRALEYGETVAYDERLKV